MEFHPIYELHHEYYMMFEPKNRLFCEYYLENLFDMLGLIINQRINYINNYSLPIILEDELKKIFKNKKPCIGIAPGAGEKNKKWKIENFLEVAKYFIKKNYNIAFFIGPEDYYEKKIIFN